jgi:hypothetical protein
MIEEYENWEDSIRRTFIEMDKYMNQNSNPLEAIIDFAWSAGADLFLVQNAKDELKKLKEKTLANPVAWARINEQGDLFDPRLCNNIHVDQKSVVPLYRK